MERLPHAMQDVVRYVYYIINRTQPNRAQPVLQPFGAFLYRHAFDGDARIAQACFRILYHYFDGGCLVIDVESLDRRAFQLGRLPVLLQIGRQVARYAEVRSRIHAVRCDVHFQYVIALDIIIFFGRQADWRIAGQYDDARMVGTYADFILCANHTIRFHATQFRPFDGKFLIAIIQLRAIHRHDDLLPCGHIWRAAYDLQRLARADVDRRHVQMV